MFPLSSTMELTQVTSLGLAVLIGIGFGFFLEKAGFGKLPVCIAKTQQSLSDNPALLGRPKDFLVTVREIQLAAGAGFIVPITGEIMRMPGLPKDSLAEKFDLNDDGEIVFQR